MGAPTTNEPVGSRTAAERGPLAARAVHGARLVAKAAYPDPNIVTAHLHRKASAAATGSGAE